MVLSSCFKEEDSRNIQFANLGSVALGANYENQIFYNISTNTVVSTNNYKIWDIGLYSGNDKSFIKLNEASNFYAINTGSTNFNATYSLANYTEEDKRYDSQWYLDRNIAINEILNTAYSSDTVLTSQTVYLISSGYDANGTEIMTPKKFVFEGIIENSYIIKFADIDGSNYVRKIIPRNETLNLTAFSFTSQSVTNVEPDKTTWDILFTRNTDTVFSTTDPNEWLTGYAVTGAYLNPYNTQAYAETNITFENINSGNIAPSLFTSKLNVIGHDWKIFTTQYTIDDSKAYVIKDHNNFIFKLRFLGFYDEVTGEKGYPSFELELVE